MSDSHLKIHERPNARILRLQAGDTNLLTRDLVAEITSAIASLTPDYHPLIIAGSPKFFSAGADLGEIAAIAGPSALEFARLGQTLMRTVAHFPAPVYAAISGYCMGGGLDLALACRHRIAAPNAVFGHRGASLGLITGWGGTQRLPRLIGKGRALAMFVTGETVSATEALRIGLVDAIADDPVAEVQRLLTHSA